MSLISGALRIYCCFPLSKDPLPQLTPGPSVLTTKTHLPFLAQLYCPFSNRCGCIPGRNSRTANAPWSTDQAAATAGTQNLVLGALSAVYPQCCPGQATRTWFYGLVRFHPSLYRLLPRADFSDSEPGELFWSYTLPELPPVTFSLDSPRHDLLQRNPEVPLFLLCTFPSASLIYRERFLSF